MRFNLNKIKSSIFYFFVYILIAAAAFSIENYVEEYEKAKLMYESNEYEKSNFILEKILYSFKDYKSANILYLKSKYKNNHREYFYNNYNKVFDYDDKYKLELYHFCIENKEIHIAINIYDSIKYKNDIEDDFMKYLYDYGIKSMIVDKYFYYSMLDIIEKDKREAERIYFEAIQDLKKGNRYLAQTKVITAIDIFSENFLYHLKLGQIYADDKNYYLAEKKFLDALELQKAKIVYYNLFKLYAETNNDIRMYEVSKEILDLKEVKRKLREIYIQNQENRINVRIVKFTDDSVYLNRRGIENVNIGDSFYLVRDSENIVDIVTGEKLATMYENVAKLRVIKKHDKIVIFKIIEKYNDLSVNSEYVLKEEKLYKF